MKGKVPNLAQALLDLPDCPVWIHEKELCKILKVLSGARFGQMHSLTCKLEHIEKGYCIGSNNEKEKQAKSCSPVPNFSREKSDHLISYPYYGQAESFHAGHFAIICKPRWLRIGSPITDLSTQTRIAEGWMKDSRITNKQVMFVENRGWQFLFRYFVQGDFLAATYYYVHIYSARYP